MSKHIELVDMEWHDTPEWTHCKGHVDKAAFAEALAEQAGAGDTSEDYPLDRIEHTYARNLQTAQSRSEGWAYEISICERGRGAYPVTLYRYPATPDPAPGARKEGETA